MRENTDLNNSKHGHCLRSEQKEAEQNVLFEPQIELKCKTANIQTALDFLFKNCCWHFKLKMISALLFLIAGIDSKSN